jgi:hypothetical protein
MKGYTNGHTVNSFLGRLFVGRIQQLLSIQPKALDSAVLPELQIAVGVSMSQGLTLLLQKVFNCSSLIEKDSQMITHNMAVVA